MVSPSLRESSPFKPFSLTLPNGATLTGISHIPPATPSLLPYLPLLVGIHGGTCTSLTYDISTTSTASVTSAALSIPFVAFDRPCYGGSTSFLPLGENQTFFQQTAKWEHEAILPILWATFGKPNGCTALVTTNHSMAVGPAIIAASLYAKDPAPAYPLAGIILSGFGSRWTERDFSSVEFGPMIKYPLSIKQTLMLSDDSLRCADPSIAAPLLAQDVSMPVEELTDLSAQWPGYWKEIAAEVRIPIMYGLGEHDWLWEGSAAHVEEYRTFFPKCERFDGSLVLGGCHALEAGLVGPGWYARCFGWAMEVCTARGIKEMSD